MMKRICWIALLLLVLPGVGRAQVSKQVEVTKAYELHLEEAEKYTIRPDMTDTMRLRPDIDYTVTPLSFETSLATRPIRPAKVTYWEFNRPKPYYLKAGFGLPLQSIAEFSLSTQHPDTGYALGYLNHQGRYAKIENDFGVKEPATRLWTELGGAAGKYLGRHILEGDVRYTHRALRRYGMALPSTMEPIGDGVGYSDLEASIRLGDDFRQLERTNFEIGLTGALFYDHSDPIGALSRGRQTDFSVSGKVGRAFSEDRLIGEVGYLHAAGGKGVDGKRQQVLTASVLYGHTTEQYLLELGLQYAYDRYKQEGGAMAENYLFPHLRLEFDLISDAVKPFVEMDGRLERNDYRSLSYQNPYLQTSTWLTKSSPSWEGRGGLTGHSANNRFSYRAYAAFSVHDNYIYWLLPALELTTPSAYAAGWMIPYMGRQTRFTLGGEVLYRPNKTWLMEAKARVEARNDDDAAFECGRPGMEGELGIRYAAGKVRVGLKAVATGERVWNYVAVEQLAGDAADVELAVGRWKAPFAVDLQFDLEWMLSGTMALFVEGRNLLGRDLYTWPTMPEYGINGLVGVRMTF